VITRITATVSRLGIAVSTLASEIITTRREDLTAQASATLGWGGKKPIAAGVNQQIALISESKAQWTILRSQLQHLASTDWIQT